MSILDFVKFVVAAVFCIVVTIGFAGIMAAFALVIEDGSVLFLICAGFTVAVYVVKDNIIDRWFQSDDSRIKKIFKIVILTIFYIFILSLSLVFL